MGIYLQSQEEGATFVLPLKLIIANRSVDWQVFEAYWERLLRSYNTKCTGILVARKLGKLRHCMVANKGHIHGKRILGRQKMFKPTLFQGGKGRTPEMV